MTIEELKDKAIEAGKKALLWAEAHPLESILIVTGVTTSAAKTISSFTKRRTEVTCRERYTYDPTLGIYYKLNRRMTNNEKVIYSRRLSSGESRADILRSMHLI